VFKFLAPLIAAYVAVAALVLAADPRAAEPAAPNAPPTSGEQAQSGDSVVETTPPATSPNPAPTAPTPAQNGTAPQETTPEEPPPVAVAAGPGSVTIADFSFSPGTVTVNTGDTVTWTNTGKEGHTATGDGFDTGLLSRGQSGSHTFSQAGTFSYICTPHPFMKGTVVVRGSSSGGGGGSSGGGSGGGSGGAAGSGAGGSDGSAASGSASSGSSGASLPASGGDAAVLGGLGLLLLALGLAIRRRAATSP